MRIGLKEMIAFSKLLFPSVKDSTFFESCGVADLITTCSKDNDLHDPTFCFQLIILIVLKQ
jgi:glycerol-3-phosphate dehydrogenase